MTKGIKIKQQATFQGKSLVFNSLMVLLNLTGLTFLVMGYHDNFVEEATLYKIIGFSLMLVSIGGLVLLKGRLMMSSIARVLVGGLFIVSGLVKANDPIGFAYKLEEYFEDGALAFRIKEWFSAPGFSMEYLIDYALFFSVLICIAEIVLGVLLIIGGKIKLVSYLMLLMMLFFTFLTWHTANCDAEMKFKDRDTYAMSDPVAQFKIDESKTNKAIKIVSQSKSELVVDEMKTPQCVADCGCFGDAMKGSVGRSLTPKESLWKDIILLYLVVWIFVSQWIIKPNNRKQNFAFVTSSFLVIGFFSWIFSWYFPIFFGLTAMFGALLMLRVGGRMLGNYYGSALIVALVCGIMVTYVLMYLPLKDYRPYAIGSDLKEKMNDGIEGVYESMLVYKNKKSGETKEYSSTSKEYTDSKIWEDTDWVYESMVQKEIVPTKNPSIMDFNPSISINDLAESEKELTMIQQILDTSYVKLLKVLALGDSSTMEATFEEYSPEGFPAEEYAIVDTITTLNPEISDIEIKDAILLQDKIVILISRNLEEANWATIDRIKAIYNECKKKDIPFIMICNASREAINAFRKKNNFDVPTFVMDEIELKIVSRSNPSILTLEKGVVKSKYPFRSIPTKENFITK